MNVFSRSVQFNDLTHSKILKKLMDSVSNINDLYLFSNQGFKDRFLKFFFQLVTTNRRFDVQNVGIAKKFSFLTFSSGGALFDKLIS